MAAVLFDTLKVVESLKSSGFSDEQARGLSEAFKTTQETSIEGLATKSGLEKVRLALKSDIETVKLELTAEIEKVRLELKAEIEKVNLELRAEIEKVNLELRAEIERSKSETLKWMFIFLAGQLVAIFAMLKAFLK
ncbi:MAG: CCDC90 family protein [Candidatus Magnetominusculus sp. LBB02]|nr:CCDC90 family protein [Candidatus Magnetominusculus sp. LBB02]